MKQLRFTTTKPMPMLGILNPAEDHKPLVTPEKVGKLIMDKIKGKKAYIHGEAEAKAGYDIPTFVDGNMAQLERPIKKQDILMILPSGEFKCKAEYCDVTGASNCYLITLVNEPCAVKKDVVSELLTENRFWNFSSLDWSLNFSVKWGGTTPWKSVLAEMKKKFTGNFRYERNIAPEKIDVTFA